MASREPSRLRSSSTWPMIMMIGSTAAVIRSPLAQAAISATQISRSVTPCRLGWRRLPQAEAITGTATSSAAPPATRSDRVRCSGNATCHATASSSSPAATIASVIRTASKPRSATASSDVRRGAVMAGAGRVVALMASIPWGAWQAV